MIADYVVAALKNLFTDADIRASSDRYLRNAIIAVLAYDRRSHAVGRRAAAVGRRGGLRLPQRGSARACARMPEFKEISEFFTAELAAQLADARSTTTAKLDAPVNKLARLLNSPSIKRVLLNDSLRVDFDRVIAGRRGARRQGRARRDGRRQHLRADAAARRHARRGAGAPAGPRARPSERVAVALKVDEAPLVLNRGFAETMALKRSAGLETVACWQTDAQWIDREVRDQLDALFAHRVYFATASAQDARAAASLTMAEFSDTVRPGIERPLGARPSRRAPAPAQAPRDRQLDHARGPPGAVRRARRSRCASTASACALHAARQAERGGRHLDGPAPAALGPGCR